MWREKEASNPPQEGAKPNNRLAWMHRVPTSGSEDE